MVAGVVQLIAEGKTQTLPLIYLATICQIPRTLDMTSRLH